MRKEMGLGLAHKGSGGGKYVQRKNKSMGAQPINPRDFPDEPEGGAIEVGYKGGGAPRSMEFRNGEDSAEFKVGAYDDSGGYETLKGTSDRMRDPSDPNSSESYDDWHKKKRAEAPDPGDLTEGNNEEWDRRKREWERKTRQEGRQRGYSDEEIEATVVTDDEDSYEGYEENKRRDYR